MKKSQSKAVDSISKPKEYYEKTEDFYAEFEVGKAKTECIGVSAWRDVGRKYKYYQFFEKQIREAELEWILGHASEGDWREVIVYRLDKINKAKI